MSNVIQMKVYTDVEVEIGRLKRELKIAKDHSKHNRRLVYLLSVTSILYTVIYLTT